MESATTMLSAEASCDFGGFVVLIRLVLIVPIVLNWACNGKLSKKTKTVKGMSLVVFILQS
jgi:hypothetical protein